MVIKFTYHSGNSKEFEDVISVHQPGLHTFEIKQINREATPSEAAYWRTRVTDVKDIQILSL
jgi:hypothetical protein